MKNSEHYLFGSFLINNYHIDSDMILEALERQQKSKVPVGRLAMDLNYMSVKQVMDTLFAQGDSERRFGEIAVELGFITQACLDKLLNTQQHELRGLGDILVDMKVIDSQQRDAFLAAFSESQSG